MTRGDPSRLQTTLARLGWGGLLVLHVPILVIVLSTILRSGADLDRLGSALSLVLAIGFFALKYRDVAFLRLRTRQQAFVAVCLMTAIVHHGALPAEADGAVVLPAAALVVGVVVGPGTLRRGVAVLQRCHDDLRIAAAYRRVMATLGGLRTLVVPSVLRWLGPALRVPRAPPA